MPLNSIPPTTTRGGVRRQAGPQPAGNARSMSAFGAAPCPATRGSSPGSSPMACAASSAFSSTCGVAEFGWVGEPELAPAMQILAGLTHARTGGRVRCSCTPRSPGRSMRIAMRRWPLPIRAATRRTLASRPPAAEEEAIAHRDAAAGVARPARARTSVHPLGGRPRCRRKLRAARAEGLPLTAETCPHYLHFTAETIPDGATPYKCAPSIRDAANREQLWAALVDGTLELVASDHSPCSPSLKAMELGDFLSADVGRRLWVSGSRCRVVDRSVGARPFARRGRAVDVARAQRGQPA